MVLPQSPGDYGAFEYIPSLDRYMVSGRAGSSFFDPTTRAWSAMEAPAPVGDDYDFSAAYDPVRDRVYMGHHEANLHWYDVQTNTWTVIDIPDPYGSLRYGPNTGAITYDAGQDMLLIWAFGFAHWLYAGIGVLQLVLATRALGARPRPNHRG